MPHLAPQEGEHEWITVCECFITARRVYFLADVTFNRCACWVRNEFSRMPSAMLNLIDKLRAMSKSNFVRGGAGTIVIRLSDVGSNLLLAIVLARFLGANEYGIYAFVYASVTLAAIPVQFGLPSLVVRETAKFASLGLWGSIRGLWRWSNQIIFLTSAVLLGVGAVVIFVAYGDASHAKLLTFIWGGLLIPLIGFESLRGSSLRGLGKVVQGLLPDRVIRPSLLIVIASIAYLVFGVKLRSYTAMALHVVAAGMAFAVGVYLLRRDNIYRKVREHVAEFTAKKWIWSAVPLGLVAAVTQINTKIDIVMLGMYVDPTQVGIYRVASVGATAVGLGYNALGIVSMPYFSRLHNQNRTGELQRLATNVARAGVVLATPVLLGFLFFGKEILSLLFGNKYAGAYEVLAVLSVVQFINLSYGKLGTLLNMCGHEKETLVIMCISAVANVAMNALLIPSYGMMGAALSTGMSYIIWKSMLWYTVRKKLSMDGSALGLRLAPKAY